MKQILFSLGLLVLLNGCIINEKKSLYPEKEVSVAHMASWGQSQKLQIANTKETCKGCYVSVVQFHNKNMKEREMTAKITDEG